MLLRGVRKTSAVGQCRARCPLCERVLPHHVVRDLLVARLARFSLFTLNTRHALICARCHTRTRFTRPARTLAVLAPLVLLLAALA